MVPTIEENVSLRPYNTFGMDVRAQLFARFRTTEELQALLHDPRVAAADKLILGGGSNLLLTRDVAGAVLKNEITEVEFIDLPDGDVLVRAGGGGNWHALVEQTLDHGLGGLENLSLIPGTVGAAPLQNIGAYGVELKDVFEYLDAVELATGDIRRFLKEDCAFGYRESVFKHELKGQFVVTYVGLKLRRAPGPFRTDYGDIRRTLAEMNVSDDSLTARHVSAAVQQIRRSKLPDPAVIGNAGSFFKNPEISVEQYEALKARFTDVPGYSALDVTLGYPVPMVPGLAFTLSAQNLLTFVDGDESDTTPFERRHIEFVGSAPIGRLVLARLTYGFR